MTYTIRACSVLTMVALGLAVVATPVLAQSAPQCVVSGSPPAGWGFNSIGYIEIASGGSCMFSVNISGEISNSSVAQIRHTAPCNSSIYLLLYTYRRLDIEAEILFPFK